jgi:diacylglycerol kinase (ATP)
LFVTSPRWLAIANPTSGGGRGRRHRERLQHALITAGVAADWVDSEYAGHAVELSARAVCSGQLHLIAVGGDGTLNEIINGALRDAGATDLTLALLPVGRGNDWARHWAIPSTYSQAAAVIAAGSQQTHDIGVARFADSERWFINVAGVGFDAAVVAAARRFSLGPASYVAGILSAFLGYRPQPMPASFESGAGGAQSVEGRALATFACLNSFCGGGMRIAPDADPCDGLLDITRIGDIGRLDLLLSLRRLFDGTLAKHPKVRCWRTRALRIEAVGAAVQTDGELAGVSPVRFGVRSAALKVVVPATSLHVA